MLSVRAAIAADAPAMLAIYNPYVCTSSVTFEQQALTAEQMVQRIEDTGRVGLPWLVLESAHSLAGYAYASAWRARAAYRHSVEGTIYIAPDAQARGLGTLLYAALLEQLRRLTIHVVIGTIALPNPASIALHEKLGFRQVGQFKQVGFKFGRWIDVGYWQRLLE